LKIFVFNEKLKNPKPQATAPKKKSVKTTSEHDYQAITNVKTLIKKFAKAIDENFMDANQLVDIQILGT
jgi:hypothetical protein